MRILAIVGLALVFSGCASSPGLYQWGGYDQQLYSAYKDPTQTAALRKSLEAHIAAMEAEKQRVAPGLYAELGTLCLQANDLDTAVSYYAKERAYWPESTGLMTAMSENIKRRQDANKQATK
ncbi:MAG: DUF4810 domain-containing protein [Pseudorhodoplanes sp.]